MSSKGIAVSAIDSAASLAVQGIRAVLLAKGVPAALVGPATDQLLGKVHAEADRLLTLQVSAPGLVVGDGLPFVVREVEG